MIAVVDMGMGNTHSLLKAASLYHSNVVLTSKHEDILSADKVLLPGDGHFHKAMDNLNDLGLVPVLQEVVQSKKPLLGICIGFHILFQDSDETLGSSPIVKGLGFFQGHVRKFQGKTGFKVPHMGWNKLEFPRHSPSRILRDIPAESFMYFIHSYRATATETKEVASTCRYYGESFPAVIEKGNLFGTQFHPEKSDKIGLKILENFCKLESP